jgi:hypothetical protein
MSKFRTILLCGAAALMLVAPMAQASAKCLGHVKGWPAFEITIMQVSKEDGVQYEGHGTGWYSPPNILLTGKCRFVPFPDNPQIFSQTER